MPMMHGCRMSEELCHNTNGFLQPAAVSLKQLLNSVLAWYEELPSRSLIILYIKRKPNLFTCISWLVENTTCRIFIIVKLSIRKLARIFTSANNIILLLTLMKIWTYIRIENFALFNNYYMASITYGEMAECDWLRSTFSGPLFSLNGPAVHYVKTNACILKQNSKTNWKL
jgi:hypothetical protein